MENNDLNITYISEDSYRYGSTVYEAGTVLMFPGANFMKLADGVSQISELKEIYIGHLKMTTTYGTGCLKSPFDERNYQFATIAKIDRTVYPEEYIPEYEPKFFDQGDSSMCCACACAMSRYIYELNDSHNTQLFSPAYIYGNRCKSVVINGTYTGEGMYLKDALKQLTTMGDCFDSSMHIFSTYDMCNSVYKGLKAKVDEEAYPFRTSSYYEVKTNKEVKKAIMLTGSVLASYIVTDGWYYTGSDGIIRNYGNVEGGHAILLTGWKVIDGKEYWIIHNSWGTEWGDNGYGYISSSEQFMEGYCILDDIKEVNLKEDEL